MIYLGSLGRNSQKLIEYFEVLSGVLILYVLTITENQLTYFGLNHP